MNIKTLIMEFRKLLKKTKTKLLPYPTYGYFEKYINSDKEFLKDFESLDQTNNKYHAQLLHDYCVSNGKVCDVIQRKIEKKYPKPNRPTVKSDYFGVYTNEQVVK